MRRMSSALDHLDLATLKQYRTEATTAAHRLAMGVAEVSVRLDDGTQVTYSETSRAKLADYIRDLNSAIHFKETGSRSAGPVYLGFPI